MHEDRNGQDRKNRIPVIGLTGGIGTGKSTVAEYLKKAITLMWMRIRSDAI